MSFSERKQRSLYLELNNLKRQAYDKLLEYHLFKEENYLTISGSVITAANDEFEFARADEIFDFYNKNSSNFIFKLIDDSIFNIYVMTDKNGVAIKSSFSYCSCPCIKDILIEEQGNYRFDILDELSDNDDQKDSLFTRELYCYFIAKCNKDDKLASSLIEVAKNPLYIRCDYDSTCVSEEHPEYHLTINFIKDSRFKIDSRFSFLDFVLFILDLVYGKKSVATSQYIHLS